MNPIISPFIKPLAILGFVITCFSFSAKGQAIFEPGKSMVIQTEEGMILPGQIEFFENEILTIRTLYGSLQIPITKIKRIDGDLYEIGRGIIREQKATLHRDGSVVLDYLQSISTNNPENTVSILVPGRVLQVSDLTGQFLSFVTTSIGDFYRCTMTVPEYCLPAVRIQVALSDTAILQNNTLSYTYNYTPRSDQLFHFTLSIPAGCTVNAATPPGYHQTESGMVWEQNLERQQNSEFSVSISLNP